MSGNDISTLLPPSIDVACRNSASSCTISGPAADVEKFVTELKFKGIFAKSVNVGNIAYHSRYIQPASQLLLKYLREIIPQNTRRSNKWVSTSVPEENWDSDLARFNSPEYHTNNLLRPVLFEGIIKHIPSNAVLIEIAPHGLLQAVLKRAVPENTTNVSLTHRSSPNGVQFLLEAIGELYLEGCEPKVSAIYPTIQYPVPCDTPSLQPFVTWDHSETYHLPKFMQLGSKDILSVSEKIIPLEKFKNKIEEQNIANQPVSELSLLLFEVWKLFGRMKQTRYNQMPIIFENIRIHSKINFFVEDPCELYMAIMRGNGDFTINQVVSKEEIKDRREETTEVGTSLISGRIKIWETRENDDLPIKAKKAKKEDANSFETFTCYRNESPSAKYEMKHCDSGICGTIKWTQDWLTFLDAMIEVNILANVGEMDHGAEPVSFRTICLMPDKLERKNNGVRIKFSIEPIMHQFGCEGVIMDGLKLKQKQKPTPHIESLEFMPFGKTSFDTQFAFIQACMRVIIESSILTPNAKEKPSKMKLCIVREETIRGLEGLVENAIGSLSEDANVEFKVFSPTDRTDFPSDAFLYISSNVEKISNLSRSGKIKHFYLLYETPNECENQNKIMYGGSNRDKFIVLCEQEFDKKKLSFFKKLNDELEPLIYHIDNNNWRSCVEDLNSNETLQDKRVHLVFWELINEDLHLVAREVLRICSIFHPRCFFVHDVVATDNSEYDRIWKEQMKRDMILNVFLNGKWGTWLRSTVPKTGFIHQLAGKAHASGVSSQIDIHYLGLDEIFSKNTENQAIILEYSGIAASGERKMGLAHRNEDVDEIILDPILQWTVPKDISLKDAASIPLAYLMANLIIRDEFCRQLGRKRVLVHNGNTTHGIACIAVALADGHTVYTTVPDDVRREYVRGIFPQVHILDASCLTQAEFLVPFMLTTDGHGFEIIISDLPEEQFLASWNFVARGGFLVNLNESLPVRSVPLPMNGFLKNVSVFSLSKRSITLLPPHRKQRLHGLVYDFLRSGKMIMIPHRPLSEAVALSQSFPGEMKLKSSDKLLLKLLDFGAKHDGILSNVTKRSKMSAPCKSDGCYIILGANDEKLSTVIKWLLKHGAKNILLADSQNRNNLLRRVSDWAVNRGATLLFSGFADPSLKGAQEILQKASKLGKLLAVFSVASAQNNEAVHNINQIMLERNISAPLISVRDKDDKFVPNIINVVCDGNVNFSDVLGHALATQCDLTVYHVTEKSDTILQQNYSQTSVTETHSDKFTDYLPCSLNELNNMGKLLSAKDYESDRGVYGKFFPAASLAPQKQLHRDVRPVFIIPAFCEIQLRPLMAKLMYRCFVAHVCLNVPSLKQLASHLLKSMMQIQKRGPYTIVAETWSGGVATALSTMITDAGHEVSLFLIQGVPQKMTSFLPSQDLSGCLVQHLFQEIKADEELKSLDSALEMLSNGVNKLYVQRAFHAIVQTMVLLQSFNSATLHRDTLILMEIGCTCDLKMSELKKMTEKSVRLVKSDSKIYKDMLKDPLISRTINDEALFAWHTY